MAHVRLGGAGAPTRRSATTQPANFGHVRPVGTHCFTTLATRRSGFVGGKFMSLTAFMGCFPTFTGNFTLPFCTH
jgi:hypothetical protein